MSVGVWDIYKKRSALFTVSESLQGQRAHRSSQILDHRVSPTMGMSEKTNEDTILPAPRSSGSLEGKVEESDNEIFKKQEGAVDFRTVGWIPASVIFLKLIFATGEFNE